MPLLAEHPYEETPYPKSFLTDGMCVNTRSFCYVYNEPLEADFVAELTKHYPELERNPKDIEALRDCITVCYSHDMVTRCVPFCDRFIKAGGDPNSHRAMIGELYMRGADGVGPHG